MSPPAHPRVRERPAPGLLDNGLVLRVRFTLHAPLSEVVDRIRGATESTHLQIMRLEVDGRDGDELLTADHTASAGRWEAVLAAPAGPGLTASDLEVFLSRARVHLPARSSVVLSGVRPPRHSAPPSSYQQGRSA